MKTKQTPWIALLFALWTISLAGHAQDAPAKEDDSIARRGVTVIALRHAEKGTDEPRNPGLTAGGEERAAALARLLSRAGVTHVFSTAYRRTEATVAPLAKTCELEVTGYDPRDLSGFVEDLRELPPGSVAVVSGHSNTTPGLVLALGGDIVGLSKVRGAPSLGEEEYDRLFLVTLPPAEGLASCVELRYGE